MSNPTLQVLPFIADSAEPSDRGWRLTLKIQRRAVPGTAVWLIARVTAGLPSAS
jgi:hypothetical protein